MAVLNEYVYGNIKCAYFTSGGRISFAVAPAGTKFMPEQHESNLPLAQVRLTGDNFLRNYSQGRTLLESETARGFKYVKQTVDGNRIDTYFENGPVRFINTVIAGDCLRIFNTAENAGEKGVTVELLPSAVISGIPSSGLAGGNISVTRFRSYWSTEGRMVKDNLLTLGLEKSWAGGWGGRYYRYGQTGSMPVRGYHPFTIISDDNSGVSWGVYSEAPASWQHEINRFGDKINVSAGTGDYEFAHNRFILNGGESVTTGTAYVTAVNGGADDAADIIVKELSRNIPYNENEINLPPMYNEYCDTWGQPSADTVKKSVDALKGLGLKYFVIDAGWFRTDKEWSESVGDWETGERCFPRGLLETARDIEAAGMIPGIWFEPEVVCRISRYYNNKDWFLKRDGIEIISENRKFLDFRNSEVYGHIKHKVIDFCRENGFRYVKSDYNDPVALADGDSPGNGLLRHIEKVSGYYEELRNSQPGFVSEICSSGGHRIEPSFLKLCNMVSFSDAHEGYEGAIVAANLHRLAPPGQLQIWSVLKPSLTDAATRYRLGQGFLGRLCVSGDIAGLSPEQYKLLRDAVDFYNSITGVIRDGKTRITSTSGESYLEPYGYQIVTRENGRNRLTVIHTFRDCGKIKLMPAGRVVKVFGNFDAENYETGCGDFDCAAFLEEK